MDHKKFYILLDSNSQDKVISLNQECSYENMLKVGQRQTNKQTKKKNNNSQVILKPQNLTLLKTVRCETSPSEYYTNRQRKQTKNMNMFSCFQLNQTIKLKLF